MNLREQLALKIAEAEKAYQSLDIEAGDALMAEVEALKRAIQALEQVEGAKTVLRPSLPPKPEKEEQPQESEDSDENVAEKVAKEARLERFFVSRFGDDDRVVKDVVLKDLLGDEYKQTLYEQEQAFAKFLRFGEQALDREERRYGRLQMFPWPVIDEMLRNGHSVRSIKATMVEAQGTLGGFAVPASMQTEVIQRLPGLTAVRGAGATVVNLTTGNSTEYLSITGGDNRYPTGLRGYWGGETEDPAERNLTFGLERLDADIYTFKVPMSTMLVEDAGNIVTIIQEKVLSTFAIDEDDAFLVGDGVKKPLGILPGGTNALGLTEVNSGAASAITADGVKALKRGIASQYRAGAVFVANSDTYGAIELLKDANGQYLFSDMTETDRLLNRRIYESEALPDVAANAYPLLFGNMRGYYIVERMGMTVMRFQDSGTTINRVEFHFRRRIGGRVVEPWQFAVQKIAA